MFETGMEQLFWAILSYKHKSKIGYGGAWLFNVFFYLNFIAFYASIRRNYVKSISFYGILFNAK